MQHPTQARIISYKDFVTKNSRQIYSDMLRLCDTFSEIPPGRIWKFYEQTLRTLFEDARVQDYIILLTTSRCVSHFKGVRVTFQEQDPMLEEKYGE